MRVRRRDLLAGLAGLAPGAGLAQTRGVHPVTPPAPAAAAAPAPAGRGSPSQVPVLMPGTGMHVGPIRALAVSPDGGLIATGGADRSIRLWSAKGGEALQRLSLPLGEGSVGVVDAVAFGAAGRVLYASGLDWAAPAGSSQGMVHVFDLDSGKLTGVMAWPASFGSRLRHMVVSPDGRQVAIAAGNNGLIVRDTAAPGFALRFSEPAHPVIATSAAAYAPDGRWLATAASTGRLRLFAVDAEGGVREAQARALPGGGEPNSLAFSPDGERLAVGFVDRPVVLVLGLRDGAATTLAAPAGTSRGNLAAVGWGRDEAGRSWVVAGGTVVDGMGRNLVVAWRDGRAGAPAVLAVAQDSITQIVPQPGGGVLFGSSDPRWGWLTIGPAGLHPRLGYETERLDYRGVGARSWAVEADGAAVEFQGAGGAPLRFDLKELQLARVAGGGGRKREAPPPALALPRGAAVRSYDRLADGRMLAGSDDYLVLVDPSGRELARREVATAAWGVAAARERPVAVAAHGDGTIRWYALDRELAELGGLFVAADGERWVAWRADGRFAHSAGGGAKLVGFQQNGRFEPGHVSAGGLTGQWLGIDQFYHRLYDPDEVGRMLTADAGPREGGAKQALPDAAGGQKAALPEAAPAIAPARLPTIQIRSLCPAEERAALSRGIRARQAMDGAAPEEPVDDGAAAVASIATAITSAPACQDLEATGRQDDAIVLPRGTTAMRVRLQLEGSDGATQVAAFVNEQNVGRAVARADASRGIRAAALEQYVPLFAGENRVEFRAYGADGRDFTRAPTLLRVRVGAPRGGAAAAKPVLRALVVGIDAYGGSVHALRFAGADATTFAGALEQRRAPEYGAPQVTTLFDGAATTASVTAALATMAAEAQPQDAVVLYFAGHGVVGTQDRSYAFLTSEVTDARAAEEGGQGFGAERLARALSEVRAERVFVFLDTCFAGAFDPRTIGYLNHDTGRYVLAASTRLEEALDGFSATNGLFAYAVKEGMDGGVGAGGRSVDAFDLGRYVTGRVEVLASQRAWKQRAVFQAAGRITAFPLVAGA